MINFATVFDAIRVSGRIYEFAVRLPSFIEASATMKYPLFINALLTQYSESSKLTGLPQWLHRIIGSSVKHTSFLHNSSSKISFTRLPFKCLLIILLLYHNVAYQVVFIRQHCSEVQAVETRFVQCLIIYAKVITVHVFVWPWRFWFHRYRSRDMSNH